MNAMHASTQSKHKTDASSPFEAHEANKFMQLHQYKTSFTSCAAQCQWHAEGASQNQHQCNLPVSKTAQSVTDLAQLIQVPQPQQQTLSAASYCQIQLAVLVEFGGIHLISYV